MPWQRWRNSSWGKDPSHLLFLHVTPPPPAPLGAERRWGAGLAAGLGASSRLSSGWGQRGSDRYSLAPASGQAAGLRVGTFLRPPLLLLPGQEEQLLGRRRGQSRAS